MSSYPEVGFDPAEPLPPAQRRIVAVLAGVGYRRSGINELLDAFAHELAERIREERDAMREESKGPRTGATKDMLDGMSYAADMIDPHPVRPDEEPTT